MVHRTEVRVAVHSCGVDAMPASRAMQESLRLTTHSGTRIANHLVSDVVLAELMRACVRGERTLSALAVDAACALSTCHVPDTVDGVCSTRHERDERDGRWPAYARQPRMATAQ
jgi:hypothetical protein